MSETFQEFLNRQEPTNAREWSALFIMAMEEGGKRSGSSNPQHVIGGMMIAAALLISAHPREERRRLLAQINSTMPGMVKEMVEKGMAAGVGLSAEKVN